MDALAKYVPAIVWRHLFAERSAIVGRGVQKGGYTQCDLHETTTHEEQMKFYAQRLMQAADRLMTAAPTHRIRGCEVDEIVQIERMMVDGGRSGDRRSGGMRGLHWGISG